MYLRIIAVFILMTAFVFIFRKPILVRFYAKLAIGKTTSFLRFLEHKLTKSKGEEPETMRQIEWVHTQPMKKAEIVSWDGLTLSGHFLEHPNQERLVIMFHGWRGSWEKDEAALAHGLYEKNCSILMTEQRAHGGSQGRYIGFGILERYDCLEWIRYATEQFGELPIYLSGVSMGASTVLMAAGEELPEQVNGVIADCGFTSPYEMVKIFASKFMHMKKEKAEKVIEKVNRLCKKKADYDLREYCTLDAMKNCQIPVFFVHGTQDHFVPYEMSVENYKACTGRKQFLSVEGAAHTKSYLTEPERYVKEVSEFFRWELAEA